MLRSLRDRTDANLLTRASVGIALLSVGLVGCKSSSAANQNGGSAPPPSTTTQEEEDSSGSMDVYVSGADATVEGDTITLEYPEPEGFNDTVPEWVINPTIGGVTGAIGVAGTNDLGRKEQLDEARLNGRLELVSMLELRVQRVGRTELENEKRIEGGGDASRGRRSTLGVDRNILDGVLAGSRQRALWLDEETGEIYVWMVLDGAVLTRANHTVVQDVSVFTANTAIRNEFRPDRKRFEKPTVIVMPEAAPTPEPEPQEQAPPPEPPKTPIEEIEDKLNELETIPTKSDDGE